MSVQLWSGKDKSVVLLQVVVLQEDGVVDGGEDVLRARAYEQLDVRSGGRRGRGGQRAAQHLRAQHQLAQPPHHGARHAVRRAQPHRYRLHTRNYTSCLFTTWFALKVLRYWPHIHIFEFRVDPQHTTKENVFAVRQLIEEKWRITYEEILEHFGIGKSQIQKILHHVKVRQLCY